jgi:DNA-binding FrmR family transcriptional regulator
MKTEEVTTHFQDDEWNRQRSGDHEPPLHVAKLARVTLSGDRLGLESHPADRARTGADLTDLGMHRAGIEGVLLDTHTGYWYMTGMSQSTKSACRTRLKRIEGQVGGIVRMVEGDRYCVDIVTQIQAVKAALSKVQEELLREHVAHCVEGAIKSGNASAQREKVNELLELLRRLAR